MNCKKINTKKAVIPSSSEIFLLRETADKVDTKAIVIIKSKAFIFVRVLLPEILREKTIPAYAKTVVITVLTKLSQLSKKMLPISLAN